MAFFVFVLSTDCPEKSREQTGPPSKSFFFEEGSALSSESFRRDSAGLQPEAGSTADLLVLRPCRVVFKASVGVEAKTAPST
jgi:hypothetical protein